MDQPLVIHPKSKDLGDGFLVRRALPSIEKRTVGPFVFWDHMGPVDLNETRQMKVRAHPHIGLATITFLFSGQIMHRDSLGNEQLIRPGEVNWMTAGKGIAHSERSEFKGVSETLEGIQLWVGLPKESEEVEPTFDHYPSTELPEVYIPSGSYEMGHRFSANQNPIGLKFKLVAGELFGLKSPIKVYSPLFYGFFKSVTQTSFQLKLGNECEAGVYVTKGSIKSGGVKYDRCSMLIWNPNMNLEIDVEANAEFMLFGGQPFPEKRHMWWNFVSSDQGKIEKAKEDWRKGALPQVINENEYIPLPES